VAWTTSHALDTQVSHGVEPGQALDTEPSTAHTYHCQGTVDSQIDSSRSGIPRMTSRDPNAVLNRPGVSGGSIL
jgi:hypothetical protein